ncbi:organic cation transporter protein-like [Ptychodera flava]|uniref:organic cation transporter protein-like n=1 Tax=Ptychodera flava TaxID=63121 RepID=UPI003969BE90
MELDDVLFEIGDFGLYQNLIFWLVSIPGNFFVSWHIMATVFTAAWPSSYHCSLAEGQHKNQSIPVEEYDENGEPVYGSCHMYVNSSVDNTTTQCTDGWDYQAEFQESIVTQWDLVCDQTALSQISQSIYMVGVMIGSLVAGYLSDRFGRKTVFLVCLWSLGIFGTLTAVTQTFVGYCILKFLAGLVQPGALVTQFILSTELYTPNKRVYAGFISCIIWAFGMMLLAVIGYLFQHWRAFQIIISAPALLTFYYYWTIPESMRWLLSKGRTAEVRKILRLAAKVNRVKLPEKVLSQEISVDGQESTSRKDDSETTENHLGTSNGAIEMNSKSSDESKVTGVTLVNGTKEINVLEKSGKTEDEEKDPEYNCLHLVRTPKMALHTTVIAFAWFVSSLVYYGLSYHAMFFDENVYAVFFLAGAVEIPAYALLMPLVARWGRRWPSCIFFILSGLTCGGVVFIPEGTADGSSLFWIKMVLLLLGKFGITAAYGIIYVWAPELYPTLLRNFGFSVCEFSASLAGIVAPLTVIAAHNNIVIPFTIFGSLSLLAGLLTLLLPETKDKALPRTIKEAENLAKAPRITKSTGSTRKDVVDEPVSYDSVCTQTE